DKLLAAMTDNVYITIDADGFDPASMPAVGTAEPNGLSWDETLDLLKKTIAPTNVVGFDTVECAPMIEGSIFPEVTLAKVAYKIIGLIAAKHETEKRN